MQKIKKRLLLLMLPVCLAAPQAGAENARPAPLPEEEMRVEKAAAPDGNRLYVSDFVFHHMVDGRLHILDGKAGRYLGMVNSGFGGLTTVAPDGTAIYVATTYYSRLYRGTRADVVEIHDPQTFALQAEIDIPAHRAQSATYRSLLAPSPDGRFLYVQNATPATSVTVVDLQQRKFVTEIQTPGCWSIQTWAQGNRFSAICGDGTLLTVTLDEQGQPVARERSAAFFDPDQDPIYIHPEVVGDERYFVSYNGNLYKVRLAGDKPVFSAPVSLLDAHDRKAAWRPGGMQIMALHRSSGTLFVNMHDQGKEGSHKFPSKEIWAFDLANLQRIGRIPSNQASSIVASQGAEPLLYSLNVERGEIDVRAIAKGYPKLRTIPRVGDTAVFMEVN
jgi:methylamine dehydrogenase heavy chain